MSFPSSPTNGQLAVINNITYVYSSTTNSWTRQQHTFNNTGPVPPTTNLLVGDIWYNTNDDTVYRYTYDGTSYYWIDIITPTVTTSTTNLNFGSVISNTFTSNSITSNTVTVSGNVTSNITNSSIVYANSYYYANGIPLIQANVTYNNITANTINSTSNLVLQSGGTTTALTLDTNQNATFAGSVSAPNTFGFKNRIINGAMVIDQRANGASTTVGSGLNFYSIDRWRTDASAASKYSIQQNAGSITPPTGYKYYLGITSASAYSLSASDYFWVVQSIEGYNINDFAWGTSSAATVTLSFWARSSLTGTFSGTLVNTNDTQVYPFSYTINSANTWEYKTVTIPGSTTGTWGSTNGQGVRVQFSLGLGTNYLGTLNNTWNAGTLYGPTGQVNLVSTNGATFYITGVQLEKGSIATPFDFRDYTRELQLCQRYFQKSYAPSVALGTTGGNTGYIEWNWGSGVAFATLLIPYRVSMRTYPTFQSYDVSLGRAGYYGSYNNGSTSPGGSYSTTYSSGTLAGFDLGTEHATWYMDGVYRTNLQFHYTLSAEL